MQAAGAGLSLGLGELGGFGADRYVPGPGRLGCGRGWAELRGCEIVRMGG